MAVPDAVVPPNVVWLAPPTAAYEAHAWWIREVGEETYERMDVAFDADATRVSPASRLSTQTGYELLLTRHEGPAPAQPFDDDSRVEGAYTVTTSDADDREPPAAAQLVDVRTEGQWGSETSCGVAPDGTLVVITIAPDEDTYALRLERLEGEDVRTFIHPHDGAPARASGAPISDFADDESGVHDYRVIAIDSAGNESEPLIVTADLGLPGACSSTDATPFAMTAALIVAWRRRARSR